MVSKQQEATPDNVYAVDHAVAGGREQSVV